MKIDLKDFLTSQDSIIDFNNKSKKIVLLNRNSQREIKSYKYEGYIGKVDGDLAIDINIEYEMGENCSRCLRPSLFKGKTNLKGILKKEEDEIFIDDKDDEDYIIYSEDILDIDELVLNQIVLSLPMRILCNEECKGICPSCGSDLNKEDCKCSGEQIDPRLAPLKDLFKDL